MPRVIRFQVASPAVKRVSPMYGPLPHLIAREGYQVESLGEAVGGYGRVVLYPHQGRAKPMVADHFGCELLGVSY